MSTSLVDAFGITYFLEQLGRCYRHPGSLYLVGGSSLILVNAKTSTFDIDLKIEISLEHHSEFIQCLRRVSQELHFNVEQASLEQFIPLPKGYLERSVFISGFGMLDVFHFDFYSLALSKLHRGNEKDFTDVVNMTQQGLIDIALLEQYFAEILPAYDQQIGANPDAFKTRFTSFKLLLT